MAADYEEAASNENAGADTVASASEILGVGYITNQEGASPKYNLLTAITTLAQAITAGVISTNCPNGKAVFLTDEAFSYFSSSPLVSGYGSSDMVDVRVGGRAKVKSANPQDFGGANNAATKEKPLSCGMDVTSSPLPLIS